MKNSSSLRLLASLGITGILVFLFQNFTELKIQATDYRYSVFHLKNLSELGAQSMAYGVTAEGEAMGHSLGDDGLWHSVIWSPDGTPRDLGVRPEFDFSKRRPANAIAQPYSAKGVWITSFPKSLWINKKECRESCNIEDLARHYELGHRVTAKKLDSYLISMGEIKNLGHIRGSSRTFSVGVNNNRQIVGWYFDDSTQLSQGFLWEKGKLKSLGAPKDGFSEAHDINDLGQIVGMAYSPKLGQRPVIWSQVGDDFKAMDLFASLDKRGMEGEAYSINNQGDVIGEAQIQGQKKPFIWNVKDGLRDLNKLTEESDPLSEKQKWTLESARGINRCGRIVGWGKSSEGTGQAYMLKPLQPLPGC